MKKLTLFAVASSLLTFAGCNRGPRPEDVEADRRRADQLQQLDQRIAQLQDLERRTADRKAAEDAQERQRLESEREALQRERDQLAAQAQSAEKRASQAEKTAQETARRADQAREGQTVSFFYPALDPHGEWVEVDRLGYCWRPNRAEDPRWRPYTDGQWVFSEYGWTWKSNEPFGWAVYHYGRWARLKRLGWVWVPGTEWGPGWVAWRQSEDYVGWAPLPPDAWSKSGFNEAVDSYYDIGPAYYTFVPADSLGEPSYVDRVVQPERNVTIINQTVNVTNITYTNVQNTTAVFNGGPNLNQINARLSLKIPKLTVQRVTEVRNAAEAPKTQQQGNVLRLAAPQLSGPPKPANPPKRVAQQVKAPEIERGWTEVPDQAVAQRVKEQQQREAKQAEQRERAGVRNPQPGPGRPAPRGEQASPAATPGAAAVKSTPKPAAESGGSAPAQPGRSPGSTPVPAAPAPVEAEPKTPPQQKAPTSTTRPGSPARDIGSEPVRRPATAPATPAPAAATPSTSRGVRATPANPAGASPSPSAPAVVRPSGVQKSAPPATPAGVAPADAAPGAGGSAEPERHRPRAVRSRPDAGANATAPSAETLPEAQPPVSSAPGAPAPSGAESLKKRPGAPGATPAADRTSAAGR